MSLAREVIMTIIQENDADETVTREDWEEAVSDYFDNKEEEKERHKAWSDDAYDYSEEGTSYVRVSVESRNTGGETLRYTDFVLDPEEVRSMFLGIRDRYTGEK